MGDDHRVALAEQGVVQRVFPVLSALVVFTEAVDVRNGEYLVFGPLGTFVDIHAIGTVVESGPTRTSLDEAMQIVQRTLRLMGQREATSLLDGFDRIEIALTKGRLKIGWLHRVLRKCMRRGRGP